MEELALEICIAVQRVSAREKDTEVKGVCSLVLPHFPSSIYTIRGSSLPAAPVTQYSIVGTLHRLTDKQRSPTKKQTSNDKQ